MLQVPDALRYPSTGHTIPLDKNKPLLVTSTHALVPGVDYTITDGKLELSADACKLTNLTTYACGVKMCVSEPCADVLDW